MYSLFVLDDDGHERVNLGMARGSLVSCRLQIRNATHMVALRISWPSGMARHGASSFLPQDLTVDICTPTLPRFEEIEGYFSTV